MFEILKIEIRRTLSEFYNFRLNIFFANLSYVVLFLGLMKYFDNQTSSIFFLLFAWYCSLHGLDSTAFIIEDEIEDRTLVNIVCSKVSLISVITVRNLLQILTDYFKAAFIFIFIYIVFPIHFSISVGGILHIMMLIIFSTTIMYLLGSVIGAFALVHKKVSAVSGFLYYVVLFFSGIFYDVKILSSIFPFESLRKIIDAIINETAISATNYYVLIAQFILYGVLFLLSMKYNTKKLFEKGTLFHV